jgi:predicted NUDIX family NTP pyrophosphohydrolase
VHAWAFELDLKTIVEVASNLFELEWPPRSERCKHSEIDRAEFFSPEEAEKSINPSARFWTVAERLE